MTYSIDLGGRKALIAGGANGIGLGIAHVLHQAGASVCITGTRASASDYNDDEDRSPFEYKALDVADTHNVSRMCQQVNALDIFVCSVGTVFYHRQEYEIEKFKQVIDVNLNGVMQMCTELKDILARGTNPSIILVGSASSFIATPGQPAYSASKGALRTLTKSLAHAWARDTIRVNCLAPGFVETKLTKATLDNETAYEASLKRIPLKRWGLPEEMGKTTLFLASPMSSYITGQTLLADGGLTLM